MGNKHYIDQILVLYIVYSVQKRTASGSLSSVFCTWNFASFDRRFKHLPVGFAF